MTGGIYCEVPIGTIYEEKVLGSVHKRMRDLIGTSNGLPEHVSMTQAIVDYWYGKVSRRMSKVLSSYKAPSSKDWYNRTVDLLRSFCMGVYYRGKLRRMYRFSGGSPEAGTTKVSEFGTTPTTREQHRISNLAFHHPDPAQRAQKFLQEYDVLYRTGFTIVIAATMPYAVVLEKKYYLHVLNPVANRIVRDVYEFKQSAAFAQLVNSQPIYGYIFESTGSFEGGTSGNLS